MGYFSTSYAGLTNPSLDLSIVQALAPTSTTPEVINFSMPAAVIAGPQKAVQQWFMNFLTIQGSVACDPQYGTPFIQQLMQNQINNDLQVQQAFSLAAKTILQYQQQRLLPTQAQNEIITAATLLDWDFDSASSSISLTVQLTFASGPITAVLEPVSLVIN